MLLPVLCTSKTEAKIEFIDKKNGGKEAEKWSPKRQKYV
jgi:hypothetical protein